MIDINELTIGQAKELAQFLNPQLGNSHVYEIGKSYFIRTVTHYYTGKLERVTDRELVLSDAAWIADTGRFSDALQSGKFNEVEPYPLNTLVNIGRDAICDCTIWQHPLPQEQV